MAKLSTRVGVIEIGFGLLLLALLVRSAQVQLFQGSRWASEARQERTERVVLEAPRGALLDRHGTPLALTQETYHVGVAPNELRDPDRDPAAIARALRLPLDQVEQELDRKYAYFAGPFGAGAVQGIRDLRGVHLEAVLNRFYPSPEFARAIIGRVGDPGQKASGLERTLDSLLAGTPGAAVVLKDRAGRQYDSPARRISAPVAGNDVVLTLDVELQEIAQRALRLALDKMDADGGDVVMLDPATGEVLAIASERRDGVARPSALIDAYEPGSVAKIFTAGALLAGHKVSPTDRVSGEGGKYKMLDRTLVDDHPLPTLNLADAIRVSSNIAMAKFAARLSPPEEFGMLRDFGLGAPTGVEFPAEASGRLPLPRDWSRPTPASLAIGYEVSVTPLQVAAAYAAIANDGVLLEPTLVREVRSPDGDILYRHHPEPVRRVVSPEVARQLRVLLAGAVSSSGTGAGAALATFTLAAKTGTARRVVKGRYQPGEYTASFAALFPADHPQLVVVVKIDNPRKGSYYAAETAAPVTRAMLEQALASRTVALDRARLSAPAPAADTEDVEEDPGLAPYVVSWPPPRDTAAAAPPRPVPDVSGRTLRDAVRLLHRRGFHVVIKGWGTVERTWPAAGASAAAGALVTVFGDQSQ